MKRIGYIAVIAGLFSLPVLCLAQAEKPGVEKAPAPMKSEAKADKMAPAPAIRRLTAKSREDARECLSFPTNREVIICAEKFL